MCSARVSYNHEVRRFLAISLVVLFCFPLISPLFALTPTSDFHLPACCRRNGTHHCTMPAPDRQSEGIQLSALRQRCPDYPKTIAPVRHEELSPVSASLLLTTIVAHPIGKPQSEFLTRFALDRSRHERGPPAFPS